MRWIVGIEHLAGEGLARRQGQRVIFARDLLEHVEKARTDAAAKKDFRRDRARLPPIGGGRARRGNIPPTRYIEFGPIRDDR